MFYVPITLVIVLSILIGGKLYRMRSARNKSIFQGKHFFQSEAWEGNLKHSRFESKFQSSVKHALFKTSCWTRN